MPTTAQLKSWGANVADMGARALIVLVAAPCTILFLAALIQAGFSFEEVIAKAFDVVSQRGIPGVAAAAMTAYSRAVGVAVAAYVFTYPPSRLRVRQRVISYIKPIILRERT